MSKSSRVLCAAVAFALMAGGHAAPTMPEAARRLHAEGRIILPSEIEPGMKGIGKSVFQGARIETFNVEVVGVLEKDNAGLDLVLIRILDGYVINNNTGIIAGMSGSPIYIDGKLVGALAYAWSYAKEPIAGVTSIVDMLRSLDDGKELGDDVETVREAELWPPVTVDGQARHRVRVCTTAAPVAPAGNDTLELRPATTFLQCSGFRPSTLRSLEQVFRPYGLEPVIGPGKSSRFRGGPLKPGAAVGLALVEGDIAMTAVGTITYRDGDQFLAFGHPFLASGPGIVPVTTAYVQTVIARQSISMKLASPDRVVGAVTQDWAAAIGGVIGRAPKMIPVTLSASDEARGITDVYHFRVVQHPQLTASLMVSAVMDALSTTYVQQIEDTVRVDLRVEAEGVNPVERTDVYYSPGFAVVSGVLDLADSVSLLMDNEFKRAPIRKVDLSVRLERRRNSATIKRMFANRTKVKPGEDVEIGVVLEPHGEKPVTRTLTLTIPKDAPRGSMSVGVGPGNMELFLRARLGLHVRRPKKLEDLLGLFRELRSNDTLILRASLPRLSVAVEGRDLSMLPASILNVMRQSRSTEVRTFREGLYHDIHVPWAVSGAAILRLTIDSKRTTPGIAPPPPPRPGGAPGSGSGSGGPPPQPNNLFADPTKLPRPRVLQQLDIIDEWTAASSPTSTRLDGATPVGFFSASQNAANGEGASDSGNRSSDHEDEGEKKRDSSSSKRSSSSATDKGRPRLGMEWIDSTTSDFLAGEHEHTCVTTRGQVQLAPAGDRVYESDELYVWSVAAAKGVVYAGTGNNGLIVARVGDDAPRVLVRTGEVAVTALAVGAGGDIYAGVAPSGNVLRVSSRGKVEETFRLPVSFVWALVADKSGVVYAGAGIPAAIYRLQSGAAPRRIATIPQEHVRCMIADGKDGFYVGTADRGVLYHVDSHGRARALFELEKGEITSLTRGPDGSVFCGSGAKCQVFRYSPISRRTESFFLTSSQKAVFSLASDGDGAVYCGTEPAGVVYRIRRDRTVSRVLEPDEAQALALTFADKSRLVVGTGNAGAMHMVKLPHVGYGVYTSQVRDAGTIARWGRLDWTGHVPDGASVDFRARSGNTEEPDDGWSDWGPAGDRITCPPGRYLQYRAIISATGETPSISQVIVRYLPANRRPEVQLRDPRGGEHWSGSKTVRWTGKDPDKDTLIYRLFWSNDDGKTWHEIRRSNQRTTSQKLDTKKLKAGAYRLKIMVSDMVSRPDAPRVNEAISEPFTIDNDPPLLVLGNGARVDAKRRLSVQASAVDQDSPIASAECRIDNGAWKPALPGDGIFDSPWEDVVFRGGELKPGQRKLEIRVRDAADNVTVKRRTLTVEEPKEKTAPAETTKEKNVTPSSSTASPR